MDVAQTEKALVDLFARDPHGAYAAYLFGSVARGDATPQSDVDVAVLLERGRPTTLDDYPTALQADLEAALGRRVDLVVLDSAPPDLVHRVLRDGSIVCDRDRARRIAFEVRARNEYFDMKPVLDRYRQTVGRTR